MALRFHKYWEKTRSFTLALLLAMVDLVALFFSFSAAYFCRAHILGEFIHFDQAPLPFLDLLKTTYILAGTITLLIFALESLYTHRFIFWEETRHIIKGITICFTIIMTLAFLLKKYEQFSRVVIALTWLGSLFFIPLTRLIFKKTLYRSRLWRKKVFILGTNWLAYVTAREIERNRNLGYDIVGFLTHKKEKIGQLFAERPVLGDIKSLEELAKRYDVKDVIVSLSQALPTHRLRLLKLNEDYIENIKIVSDIGNIFGTGFKVEILGDIVSLSVPRNLLTASRIFLKFIFETIIASFMLPLALPLMLLISIAIKIDSPGPIFYLQNRMGKGGKIFSLIKFRSMYVDGNQRLASYLEKNPEVKNEWQQYRKLRGYDPRVTRVGRFLRKFSLDELPQLFNFFKRDINLVGPRPYMPEELDKMADKFRVISRVKPGITGLWQVRGRNLLPFKRRLLLDEFYVRNWSLWLDIVILIRTIKAVATREGAF